jgi:hypothetical protein
MSGMKIKAWGCAWAPVFLFAATMAVVSRAAAQDASIEFVARATPSAGLEEPVRGFPFFLLSKSFVAIEKEAGDAYPKPDMDAFIKKLDVSPELKAWMKKNECVTLSGENFTHMLRADDILGVPEFKTAYMDRTAGDQTADFPKPKYKASDQTKNPAKYKKLSDEYIETIRQYIVQHPQSTDGLDINLSDIDPGPKWTGSLGERVTAIHRRTLDLAQSNYMVARAETDLQGQGFIRGLAPGTYWLSTLDVPATVGDARPRWDIPVVVRAGETKYVALSSANSIRPQASQ